MCSHQSQNEEMHKEIEKRTQDAAVEEYRKFLEKQFGMIFTTDEALGQLNELKEMEK